MGEPLDIKINDELAYLRYLETSRPSTRGRHRDNWAVWGEYEYIPSGRWVHNVEHGGFAFLYDTCVPTQDVCGLRKFVLSLPGDDGGPFRYILSPQLSGPQRALQLEDSPLL